MKKSLQILFGLLLILVLAYVAFLDVSTKIKDDLVTKTKVMFSQNNVKNVSANIAGDGLGIRRTLVLTGTAISKEERANIARLAQNIEGVCHVDNQIEIQTVVSIVPTAPLVPKVPTVVKVPVVKANTQIVTVENNIKEKELVLKKSISRTVVSAKIPLVSVPLVQTTTKVPAVPTVVDKGIVVPTPIKAIVAPKVIEIEKIKLEGVK